MVRTVFIQLVLFLLPFTAYAIYRLIVSDAQADGRKTWPISILFGLGLALALAGWVVTIALQDKAPANMCWEPARNENGVIIPKRQVPCERDLSRVGIPASRDPGGEAQGASDPVPPLPGDADPQILTPEEGEPVLRESAEDDGIPGGG